MVDGFVDGGLPFCLDTMIRHIGQTVTIFTTSGGISGSGFTGILVSADINCVRLICDIGMPPACPIGSSCIGVGSNAGFGFGSGFGGGFSGGFNNGFFGNPFGSIAVIPTRAIACFTHNALC